jgi:UDP:flavonoid glycosyltransferase YjiC (YdhE family)
VARTRGIPVASVHDLGLGAVASDLAIDCSLPQPRTRWPARRILRGARYAVLAPLPRRPAPAPRRAAPPVIVVGLGGGQHARAGVRLAAAIARACPDADVRASAGFLAGSTRPPRDVTILAPSRFRAELAAADVVVSGGGVTLYEAAAAGVPAVALAVVPAQRPTVTAFVRAGLAVDAGRLEPRGGPSRRLTVRVVAQVKALLADRRARTRIARRGPRLIDGRGVERVRSALEALYHARRAAPVGRAGALPLS